MSQIFEIDITNLSSLDKASKTLIDFFGEHKVILFDAPMGSGKTTTIKSLCSYLGVFEAMSSPTYAIINEYKTKKEVFIYHMDLYRIKSSQELIELGFEEYLYSNNYIFIEWPEFAIPFLESYVMVNIILEKNNRYLRAQIIR